MNNLKIYDFYYIDYCYLTKLTDNVLKAYKHIKKLNVACEEKITNINHLKNLEILYVDNCDLCDEDIKGLDLIKLSVDYNPRITNLNNMTNLEFLSVGFSCGVSDNGVSSFKNLKLLHAIHNKKVTRNITVPGCRSE